MTVRYTTRRRLTMSNKELTTEEYRLEVMKARLAQIVVEYEGRIADYEIALAQARQQAEPEAKRDV